MRKAIGDWWEESSNWCPSFRKGLTDWKVLRCWFQLNRDEVEDQQISLRAWKMRA